MIIRILSVILTLVYPFMVYWGLQHLEAIKLLPLLLIIIALRWFSGSETGNRWVLVFTAIGIVLLAASFGAEQGLLFYPVLVNFSLLLLFGASLNAKQTVIEKLARLKEPDLPEEGIKYTRKVTQVWCLFFLVNGSAAGIISVFGTEQLWLIYNGLISYLLIGALISGEWIVRYWIRNKS